MKKACSLLIIITLLTLLGSYCYAQAPTIPIPRLPQAPKTPTVGNSIYPYNPQVPNTRFSQQAQQEAIRREVQEHQHYLKEVAKAEVAREQQRQTDIMMLTKYGFPMQSQYEGTDAFYSAFEELNDMLSGQETLNLGRAVFLTENAWHNNKLNYNDYREAIKASVDFCNQKIEEEKLDKNDNLVKNMMLFRFMSDTLQIRDEKTGQQQTHLPFSYNYDDYDSHISYDSHFVTTLMRTGLGQCLSMPLYYLVLSEEIGSEAYWAFSPKHSFVKIQDERGNWYNIELTCKAFLSDTHYMNSSFIKSEALQNKIYLEPMDKTNIVAEQMLHLARCYYQKYGFDDFVLKCVDTAQEYLDNKVNAKILKSAYQTRLTLTILHLLNNPPPPDILKEEYPDIYKHYELMLAQYQEIDDMGYEELPNAVYAIWLDHIAKEKAKADKAKMPSIFLNVPKE